MTHKALISEIKKTFEASGMSQDKLAELSGLTQPYISRFLNGEISPRIENICKIVEALECELKLEFKNLNWFEELKKERESKPITLQTDSKSKGIS